MNRYPVNEEEQTREEEYRRYRTSLLGFEGAEEIQHAERMNAWAVHAKRDPVNENYFGEESAI